MCSTASPRSGDRSRGAGVPVINTPWRPPPVRAACSLAPLQGVTGLETGTALPGVGLSPQSGGKCVSVQNGREGSGEARSSKRASRDVHVCRRGGRDQGQHRCAAWTLRGGLVHQMQTWPTEGRRWSGSRDGRDPGVEGPPAQTRPSTRQVPQGPALAGAAFAFFLPPVSVLHPCAWRLTLQVFFLNRAFSGPVAERRQ